MRAKEAATTRYDERKTVVQLVRRITPLLTPRRYSSIARSRRSCEIPAGVVRPSENTPRAFGVAGLQPLRRREPEYEQALMYTGTVSAE